MARFVDFFKKTNFDYKKKQTPDAVVARGVARFFDFTSGLQRLLCNSESRTA